MIIGITGGIGAGKTLVAEIFRQLNVPVYDADGMAKRLMNESEDLKTKITSAFGSQSYKSNQIDRNYLAQRVFKNESDLKLLNSIVHPVVLDDFQNWCKIIDNQILGIESAILIESGFHRFVDKVLHVQAPMHLRIQRIIQRDRVDASTATQRIQAQLSDKERNQYADFLLENDGRAVLPQIETILASL